jgi:tetratricopeptide (TPR) repeat protein
MERRILFAFASLLLAAFPAWSQIPPMQAQQLLEKGVSLLNQGKAADAEPILRQAAAVAPENALIYYYLGSAQMEQRKYSEASVSLGDGLRADEKKPALTLQLKRQTTDMYALSFSLRKEYARARQIYEAYLAKDPDPPGLLYNLACVCALEGDRRAALAALGAALDADKRAVAGPVLPDPNVDEDLRGLWGDPLFQATTFSRLGPQPSDGPATPLVREGARLLASGDAAKAVALGEQATQTDPKDAVAWFLLGGALEEAKGVAAAQAAFSQALALNQAAGTPLRKPLVRHAELSVGRAFLEQKKFAEAVKAFQSAADANPYRPQAFYGLAQAYAGEGDKAQAGLALKRAFALRETAPALDLPLPDPEKDPAFSAWWNDKDWRELLQGL